MSALLPLKPGAEPQPRSGHRFQVAFQEPVSGGENPVQTRNGQADRKSARGQPAVLGLSAGARSCVLESVGRRYGYFLFFFFR